MCNFFAASMYAVNGGGEIVPPPGFFERVPRLLVTNPGDAASFQEWQQAAVQEHPGGKMRHDAVPGTCHPGHIEPRHDGEGGAPLTHRCGLCQRGEVEDVIPGFGDLRNDHAFVVCHGHRAAGDRHVPGNH